MNDLFSRGFALPRPSCTAIAALLLAGALLTDGVAAAPTYRIVELPLLADTRTSSANGINVAGEVVGFAETTSFEGYAVAWGAPPYSPRRLVGLVPADPAYWSIADAINDAGYVVGAASISAAESVAVMWDPSGAIIRLGDLPGEQLASRGRDINIGGAVAGYATRGTSGGLQFSRPVIWPVPQVAHPLRDGRQGFGSSQAHALNDARTVVGVGSVSSTGFHAFRWAPGVGMQDLGDLPGGADASAAYGVNHADQVVGYGVSGLGKRAVMWNADGSMVDLGDLTGGSSYEGVRINASGRVVGHFVRGVLRQAFVWTAAEGMTDLVTLIDPADPLRAQFASVDVYVFAINDAGAIVGNMGVPGSSTNSRAFVLVPQP